MDKRLNIPEMILISGSGQNSGKTTLSEEIIKYLSEKVPVTAIKTSPHFHKLPTDTGYIFHAMPDYIVIKEEDRHSEKDTSRMLRAGSTEAYLILATNEKLMHAFLKLHGQFQAKQVIVCESPALASHLRPGLFFFMVQEKGSTKGNIEFPSDKESCSS